MIGISSEIFFASAAILVVATIVLTMWLESRHRRGLGENESAKVDLLRYPMVAKVVRWRPFQFVLRLPFVLLFFLVVFAGFFGNQETGKNIAPFLTWTIWWAALIFVVPFLGKIWCLVCPWNAMAEWIQRFSFWRVKSTTTSMNLPWPKALKNIYPAIVLFIVLTWLELGFGVTISPLYTAGLAVLILILAVLPAMYFDRKPFCRYGCLVGMISGAYAQLSTVEVRSKDRDVCHACRTKDCIKGNKAGYGCPVSVYPGTMDRDTYCILCTECVKTCPKGNIAFNLRGFASSVIQPGKLRMDEALMVIAIFGLTFFHGVVMTPAWMDAVHGVHNALGGAEWWLVAAFSVGMLLVLVLPGLFYAGVIAAAKSIGSSLRFRSVFITFSYVLLPVALFYHLAHNSQHLLREGLRLIPLLSDPMGWGWNLFGTAGIQLAPLVSLGRIQMAQTALVMLGQLYAIYLAFRIADALNLREKGRLPTLLPVIAVALVLSLADLWLLSLPMQSRMGGM